MNNVLAIDMQQGGPFFSQLPIDDVMAYFDQCMTNNPRQVGEYKAIVMRINHLLKQATGPIKIQASEADRIERLHLKLATTHILIDKKGQLFCPQCQKPHNAEHIIYEIYQREQTSGKRFYCKHNHLMLDMIDLKVRPQ